MPTAHPTAEPGAASGPADQRLRQPGRLLGLVRKLISYGRELVASLQQQEKPGEEVVRSFGTINFALIIARITRGLAIAAGLEARLERTPPAQEKPRPNPNPERTADRPTPRPVRPCAERTRPTRRRRPSPSEDDAALLRGLPSAEEIAEMIRHRPAGSVIVDICRDLGVTTTHPLWRDICHAIMQYNGSLLIMLKVWFTRNVAVFVERMPDGSAPPPVWGGLFAVGADPP